MLSLEKGGEINQENFVVRPDFIPLIENLAKLRKAAGFPEDNKSLVHFKTMFLLSQMLRPMICGGYAWKRADVTRRDAVHGLESSLSNSRCS